MNVEHGSYGMMALGSIKKHVSQMWMGPFELRGRSGRRGEGEGERVDMYINEERALSLYSHTKVFLEAC